MLPCLKSNITEWLLLQMVICQICSQWSGCQTFIHKLYLLSFCSLFTRVCYSNSPYLSWHSACLYFLKWFCFWFSKSTEANYHCSLFDFNPQCSQFSLGFAFTHSHSIFFFPFCVWSSFMYSQERSIVRHREWKGFLELIFIFCAMPMAFSESVMS